MENQLPQKFNKIDIVSLLNDMDNEIRKLDLFVRFPSTKVEIYDSYRKYTKVKYNSTTITYNHGMEVPITIEINNNSFSVYTRNCSMIITPYSFEVRDGYDEYTFDVNHKNYNDGVYSKENNSDRQKIVNIFVSTLKKYWDNNAMKTYYDDMFKSRSLQNEINSKKSLTEVFEDYKREKEDILKDKSKIDNILNQNGKDEEK
jgi:hypothetical protein